MVYGRVGSLVGKATERTAGFAKFARTFANNFATNGTPRDGDRSACGLEGARLSAVTHDGMLTNN